MEVACRTGSKAGNRRRWTGCFQSLPVNGRPGFAAPHSLSYFLCRHNAPQRNHKRSCSEVCIDLMSGLKYLLCCL